MGTAISKEQFCTMSWMAEWNGTQFSGMVPGSVEWYTIQWNGTWFSGMVHGSVEWYTVQHGAFDCRVEWNIIRIGREAQKGVRISVDVLLHAQDTCLCPVKTKIGSAMLRQDCDSVWTDVYYPDWSSSAGKVSM